jgi:CubicO group peptidase (beta-lactamase class C family)
MSIPLIDDPAAMGLWPEGIARVYAYVREWIDTDRAAGAAIGIARRGVLLNPEGFGRMAPDKTAPPLPADAVFLTASVTKPVTCTAAALLIERGLAQLDTPVAAVVPEFGQQGKDRVTVRHLLTHTSGLPDMIPENTAYRMRFAPLSEFIDRICTLDLRFAPGTDISYQSMGIAMLGEIVRRVTGTPLPAFLRQEIFQPLGMQDTALGCEGIDVDRVPHIRLPAELYEAEWSWNRAYWRGFGAPWGGMFSTVRDMNLFCQMFLHGGVWNGGRVLAASTVEAMTVSQTAGMAGVPEEATRQQAWGLGWRINHPRTTFGVQTPPSAHAFGHYGATGTMVWADPETGLSCAVFTNQPDMCESEAIRRCSDLIAASVMA